MVLSADYWSHNLKAGAEVVRYYSAPSVLYSLETEVLKNLSLTMSLYSKPEVAKKSS